ncbi:hypothetical protein [Streptomyces sp. CA-106110]|uniref:hypothetical protein n=1 Tax=Streptomyces sp. CA-106110 TaxID=3240044 RepID=UPI003D8AF6C1
MSADQDTLIAEALAAVLEPDPNGAVVFSWVYDVTRAHVDQRYGFRPSLGEVKRVLRAAGVVVRLPPTPGQPQVAYGVVLAPHAAPPEPGPRPRPAAQASPPAGDLDARIRRALGGS